MRPAAMPGKIAQGRATAKRFEIVAAVLV